MESSSCGCSVTLVFAGHSSAALGWPSAPGRERMWARDWACFALSLAGGACHATTLPALVRTPTLMMQPSLDIKPFMSFPVDSSSAVGLFPNFNTVSTCYFLLCMPLPCNLFSLTAFPGRPRVVSVSKVCGWGPSLSAILWENASLGNSAHAQCVDCTNVSRDDANLLHCPVLMPCTVALPLRYSWGFMVTLLSLFLLRLHGGFTLSVVPEASRWPYPLSCPCGFKVALPSIVPVASRWLYLLLFLRLRGGFTLCCPWSTLFTCGREHNLETSSHINSFPNFHYKEKWKQQLWALAFWGPF